LKQDRDASAKRIRPKLATHFFCFLLVWLFFFLKTTSLDDMGYKVRKEKMVDKVRFEL
jgi:hypothetical protein